MQHQQEAGASDRAAPRSHGNPCFILCSQETIMRPLPAFPLFALVLLCVRLSLSRSLRPDVVVACNDASFRKESARQGTTQTDQTRHRVRMPPDRAAVLPKEADGVFIRVRTVHDKGNYCSSSLPFRGAGGPPRTLGIE